MHASMKTGKWFLIALAAAAASFSGSLFLSLSSLMLNDGGKEIRWILAASLIIPACTAVIFYITRHRFVRYVLVPAFSVLLILTLRQYITAKYPLTLIPGDLFIISSALFISAYSIFFILTAGDAFLFLLNSFREERDVLTHEEFQSKLRSNAADKPNKMSSLRTLRSLFRLLFFIILFALLSHIKNSSSSVFLTICITIFFFSSLAVYLFTRQFTSLAEWRLAERKIPSDITRNWNTVIAILLSATFIISLSIPHSFSMYDSSFIRNFLIGILNLFTINPYHQSAPVPVEIINPEQEISGSRSPLPGIIRTVILTGIAVHALIGLTGGIIKKFYRKSEYGEFAQFCIRQYEWWIIFLANTKEVLTAAVRLLLFPFTVFFRKKIDNDEEVKKGNGSKIYSMFKNFEHLPNEKKAEIRAIVDEFLKVSHQASRRGYPYRLWMGPSEYLESLIALIPQNQSELETTAHIFNESRYSPRILPKSAVADFKKHAKTIINSFPPPISIVGAIHESPQQSPRTAVYQYFESAYSTHPPAFTSALSNESSLNVMFSLLPSLTILSFSFSTSMSIVHFFPA
jgi:hypothetical protein